MRHKDKTLRLSESAEDYLEIIGKLCAQHGKAQVSDIAALLGVKKPSVTAAVRHLAELGLVEYRSYSPITLTEEGQLYADKVYYVHKLLHAFFENNVGIESKRAEVIACHMEHVLTAEEVEQFERFRQQLPSA